MTKIGEDATQVDVEDVGPQKADHRSLEDRMDRACMVAAYGVGIVFLCAIAVVVALLGAHISIFLLKKIYLLLTTANGGLFYVHSPG